MLLLLTRLPENQSFVRLLNTRLEKNNYKEFSNHELFTCVLRYRVDELA